MIISGSMSIVTSFSSLGSASRRCDDIPDPLPITAPWRAFGACARVMSGSSTWVLSSPSSRLVVVVSVIGSNHVGESEASGLPLVASE